ncbi:sigma-70 family RNA polymerase sigma factor [Tuanshanicoccus lijuaniae]|uniref:sigma-70 family RNA polymerase sigma factor n=1 Tax=Aerococcaceae bacterium zg-1292 TaxID=2774330 RepID=UPI00193740BD|nr:sigma-70 family RNA polymerase sigma factor [Aerococcaceae bacterium zg-1292]MBF6625383.1 sigma-70 family RNA polymerase sigma factor [Aerococcaceae bacterium zg-BR9]MBS4456385.1 sigma-70 family RNA polymerase sigma factor [Aerococcaceae bacterium zg-A91]MBS4458199.1 sigma-70 family RNA polymerase sigma factor [Aerococcaceae bacterium zg-BR33]QQA37195.1 sigma-70 family RNA polymerase sigma factor [Aerococcaceae bacterium zg-1292]
MNVKDLSNEVLIEHLKDSFENDCFAELYNRFMPLYYKCMRTIRIEGFEPDDYLQEARIIWWSVIEKYDKANSPYVATYFARVFENYLSNIRRDRQAIKRGGQVSFTSLQETSEFDDFSDNITYLEYYVKETTSIDEQIILQETVDAFINSLTHLERVALCNRLLEEDNNISHIAEQLHTDRRSVENALARCRIKCKKYFDIK